ncbi:MAG TPA: alcohol dehydrogenase catalytic domain-containing protein, partial [Phycisphaerae bacterium]|nr:alcohol dehydrogenase catalytic domain-containing protein [Phycisphaerae bacterium]
CGTDIAAVFQRTHPANILRVMTRFPVTLGHENVAVIEEVGEAVADWRPGQRVVVEPSLSCAVRGLRPPCRPCREGCFTLCERFLDPGEHGLPPGMMIGWNSFTGGSWSREFVAHASQLYAVPDAVSDEEAVVVDPIASAVHAVLRRRPVDGERVLVIGGGIIGLGVVMAIRALGGSAGVTALVRHEHQAERMRTAGANETIITRRGETHARRYDAVAAAIGGRRIPSMFGNQAFIGGYDLTYDCIGTGRSLTDAMKFTRARGTVVEVGTSQIAVVDTTPLWLTELTVLGSNGRQFELYEGRRRHTYEVVFDLAAKGRLSLKGLLTHTFALDDYPKAFHALSSRRRSGVLKAAFRPS